MCDPQRAILYLFLTSGLRVFHPVLPRCFDDDEVNNIAGSCLACWVRVFRCVTTQRMALVRTIHRQSETMHEVVVMISCWRPPDFWLGNYLAGGVCVSSVGFALSGRCLPIPDTRCPTPHIKKKTHGAPWPFWLKDAVGDLVHICVSGTRVAILLSTRNPTKGKT